ncbi:neprilysin-2 [Rhipicephalus sanguineus]|uniref:neprilysin-2 n=1 Tax=Rhipicephalus sanguineus TaxID=34632 RepID=UPI0020C40E32|nr:neprilysin-2 [Rhipicephalus sanguineus]
MLTDASRVYTGPYTRIATGPVRNPLSPSSEAVEQAATLEEDADDVQEAGGVLSYCATHVSPCLATLVASLAYASLYALVPHLVTTVVAPRCFAPDCYDFPKELAMAMDPSVDPCTDFYQFTCGRWSKVHPVDTNQFTSLQRKIFFSLYTDIRRQPSSAPSRSGEKSAQALVMCEDIFVNREENLEGLRAFLGDHGLGWPDAPLDSAEFNVLDALVGLSLDADVHFLFQMKLVPNFRQDDRLILSLSQNQGLMLWFQHRALHLPGAALGKTMLQLAKALGTPGQVYASLVEDMVQMDTDLMSMYFEFKEKDLIGYSQFQELGDLSAGRVSSERWLEAINRHLPEEAQMSELSELYIIGTAYLGVAGRFLGKYAREPDRLRLFVSWHVARSLMPLASYELTKALQAETSESQMAVTYLELCIGRVSEMAPFALAHFFFAKFLPAGALKTADRMVNAIRDSSLLAFRNLSWMEDATRREAVNKLSSLHEIVAFPKELSSAEAIDAHYSYLPKFRRPFLRTYTESLRAALAQSKPLLRGGRGNRSINRELYLHAQPIPVNAFYMFVYHVMFIMPSIQFPPYFARSLPTAARYGGLGHVVGHEITHVFDPFMGNMDQTGVKVNWFSEASRLSFIGRLECLVRQYSEASSRYREPTSLTLSEDFADNSGFEHTFAAYRRAVGRGSEASGVAGFGNDQLFFLASCHKWCSARAELNSPYYSPKNLRCNVPLMNSAEFAVAYGCRRGAPMNPVKKCTFK